MFTEPTHVPRADLQIAKAKSSGGVSWTAKRGLWRAKEDADGQMVAQADPLGIFISSSSTGITNVSTFNIAPGPDSSSAPIGTESKGLGASPREAEAIRRRWSKHRFPKNKPKTDSPPLEPVAEQTHLLAEEHDVTVGPTVTASAPIGTVGIDKDRVLPEPASAPIGTVGEDEDRVPPEPASAPIGTAGEGEDNDDDMPPLNNIRAPVLRGVDSAPVTSDPIGHGPSDYAGQSDRIESLRSTLLPDDL